MISLLLYIVFSYTNSNKSKRIDQLNQSISNLEEKITGLKSELDSKTDVIDAIILGIKEENSLESLKDKLNKLNIKTTKFQSMDEMLAQLNKSGIYSTYKNIDDVYHGWNPPVLSNVH